MVKPFNPQFFMVKFLEYREIPRGFKPSGLTSPEVAAAPVVAPEISPASAPAS